MKFFQHNFFKKQLPFIVAVPAIIWQILFLYVPLLFLLSASLFRQWPTLSALGFTFDNVTAIGTITHAKIIAWSLGQALAIAFACLLIGYPVAYFFAVKMRRWKNFFLFFLMLPFWTNFLVQAYAWFFVLERGGFLNKILLFTGIIKEPAQFLFTPLAVAVVMLYCYLPFMILPLYGALEKFDLRLIEASLDLGASSVKTFFKITLPLTMPAIRNGLFLVLVPAFGEYAIPAVMGGGRYLYVGSLIASYFLESRSPGLGASFTAASGLIILIVVYLMSRIMAGPKYVQQQEQ